MTASVGVAPVDAELLDGDQLLLRADQALYAAKAAGRDRLCVQDALLPLAR